MRRRGYTLEQVQSDGRLYAEVPHAVYAAVVLPALRLGVWYGRWCAGQVGVRPKLILNRRNT